MSVTGIRTTPSQLLLAQAGAPSLTPTPPLSQHPPPMSSLPSSAAVNNEWFPNCLSGFLHLISDTVRFHSVNMLGDAIWCLIAVFFNGRNLLISCFSYPVLSSTVTAAGWQQACHQPPNVNNPQVHSEVIPSSFWNPSLPPGTHSKPTFSSSDGSLFLSIQTVWNGATEHKDADIRHCANSIADIEFWVAVIGLTISLTHLFLYFFIYIFMYLFNNRQL